MKKVTGYIKLQVPAGKANPSPPIGPALGQHGVNIMEFCKQFNARTQAQTKDDLVIPVEITVFSDRSFTFIAKVKLPDLNTTDLEAAIRTIAGTAKSLGIDVVD